MEITVSKQNNHEYEVLFDDLIREVFGFSFHTWLEHQLWDERYESYSIINDGVMLANLCVFKTEMMVLEKRFLAIQFGTVCTRKNEQGNGLSRILMEHVLSLYADTPAFLFANDSVIDFYPRFGFRQEQTYKPTINIRISNHFEPVKLSVDDNIFKDALKNRVGHSTVFDCLNTDSIQMFHFLMEYQEDIYLLPECDAIIVANQTDARLFIADVISRKPVTFEQIKAELPFNGIETIEFGFCPDWLDVQPSWEPVSMNDVMFFIKGEWNLPDAFRFPTTSIT